MVPGLIALSACKGPQVPAQRTQFKLITPSHVSFSDQATYQSTLESIRNVALAAEIDGRIIAIRAAPEPLLAVRHHNLARIAWHVGNRHTPCQILDDHLLIREDPVLQKMLQGLGAEVTLLTAPFTPEGGAYGHGRTHGHQH